MPTEIIAPEMLIKEMMSFLPTLSVSNKPILSCLWKAPETTNAEMYTASLPIISELNKQLLHLESTLEELVLYDVGIEYKYSGSEVISILNKNPLLPGIIVTEEGQFIGMVSRQRFFEYMSRPYSLELFGKRPFCSLYQFLRTELLIFSSNTSIVAAVQQCLQRSPQLAYEPLVVQIEPGVFKLLDVQELLLAYSQIHQLARDVLRESQQALFQEKELAQITLQSIGDAVITTDALGYIQSLNSAAEKLTGWQDYEARTKPLGEVFRIISESNREAVKNPVEIVLEKGCVVGLANHTILIHRDGSEIGIYDSAAPIRTKGGQIVGAVLVFRDVSQERSLASQLSWQASHDCLTGLVNRYEFEQRLEQALSSAKSENKQYILCYLDLDRFKLVNDNCGHIAGDELLRQITGILQSNIRSSDVLARIGGDEFALLLDECSLEQGANIANDLRDRIQKFRFFWYDKTFTIGISIGLTTINIHSQNVTTVLSAADAACYAAKNKGRNRVHIYQIDDRELAQHKSDVSWISIINRALEQGNFRLYYQTIAPIEPVENETTKVQEHYEVLVRLVDETGQLVSPAAFIPVAERYNLMPAIDRWIIRTLFMNQGRHYQKIWQQSQERGLKCGSIYTINLSGASINDEQFIEFLHEQFIFYKIPPQLICFEITETVAIANLQKASQFIQSLKQIGCHFALDDFGSGMSSFAYLKNLPVDYLKIDGSFVKDIVTDPIASGIVEAINHIAKIMGLKTIAEFVENDDILTKLRAMGINYAQGYAIAKPLPFLSALK